MKDSSKKGGAEGIIISAAIGFIAAIIIMAIVIYFGYHDAYSSGVDYMNVSLFGLDIYSLSKTGNQYSGSSVGTNMGVICGIFMAAAICMKQISSKIVSK